jgi:hypothetical protein
MRSAIVVSAALLLGAFSPASAGVVYDFVTTIEAPRNATRITGRVWIDGRSYRAELAPDPTRTIDVVISTDADRTAMFIDVDKRTWSERVRVNTDVRSSSLFRWPISEPRLRGTPAVAHRTEPGGEVAGQRATLHVVTARFEVESTLEGQPVGGTIETTARIWIAGDVPSLPMDRQLRTGYPEVDRKLEPIFESMHGMIVRHELEVTRTMDGGPPQTELTKTVVNNLRTRDIPAAQFEVPAGFEYRGSRAP